MLRSDRKRRFIGYSCSTLALALLFGACASYPQAAAYSLCEVVRNFEKHQGPASRSACVCSQRCAASVGSPGSVVPATWRTAYL
jgi:hypothetical protein